MPIDAFDFSEAIRTHSLQAETAAERKSSKTLVSRRELPGAVEALGWHYGGEHRIPQLGSVLLVGVAPWSDDDLASLSALARSSLACTEVVVFSLDEALGDLEARMPGIPAPMATPVVAEYHSGVLKRTAEGKQAHDLLRNFR